LQLRGVLPSRTLDFVSHLFRGSNSAARSNMQIPRFSDFFFSSFHGLSGFSPPLRYLSTLSLSLLFILPFCCLLTVRQTLPLSRSAPLPMSFSPSATNLISCLASLHEAGSPSQVARLFSGHGLDLGQTSPPPPPTVSLAYSSWSAPHRERPQPKITVVPCFFLLRVDKRHAPPFARDLSFFLIQSFVYVLRLF